jgi:hypothetical protein
VRNPADAQKTQVLRQYSIIGLNVVEFARISFAPGIRANSTTPKFSFEQAQVT